MHGHVQLLLEYKDKPCVKDIQSSMTRGCGDLMLIIVYPTPVYLLKPGEAGDMTRMWGVKVLKRCLSIGAENPFPIWTATSMPNVGKY
jgi:hypothetical protein